MMTPRVSAGISGEGGKQNSEASEESRSDAGEARGQRARFSPNRHPSSLPTFTRHSSTTTPPAEMAQSSSSYPDGRPAAPSGLPSHSSASLYAPSFSHLQQQQQQPSSPSPFYGAPPSDNAPLLYAPHALSLPAPMAYAGQHQVYGQQQQPLVGGAGAGGYGQPHGGLPVGRTPLVHAASETAK
jgi:hypothetical protein